MICQRTNKSFVLFAVLWGLCVCSVSAADLVHQVGKGETVYSISRLYKITQEDLMRYNNIADASKLQLGMRLAIPSGTAGTTATSSSSTSAPAAAYSEYTVSKNDTLYSIARSRGVTLQALRDLNGFSKNYVLKAGEKIKVPFSNVVVSPTGPSVAVKPGSKPLVQNIPVPLDPSVRWPVAAKEIHYMNSNSGVLLYGNISESIKSLTGGVVVHASPWRGYGKVAVIETSEGYRYLYGSCETLSVKKGDSIEPGTELGKLGIYPASGKPELVLIVSQNGSPVDPAKAPRF